MLTPFPGTMDFEPLGKLRTRQRCPTEAVLAEACRTEAQDVHASRSMKSREEPRGPRACLGYVLQRRFHLRVPSLCLDRGAFLFVSRLYRQTYMPALDCSGRRSTVEHVF